MTQPPLSTAINQLEKQLGVRLLERTPRGVIPTAAGRYLIGAGTDLLQQVTHTERYLRALGRGTQGMLSIAAVPSYSWGHMARLLTEFTARAPRVEVTLTDLPSPQVIESVLQQQAQIGVVATSDIARFRDSYKHRLHVVGAAPLPLLAMLPPAYRQVPDPVDLAMLLQDVWIMPSPVAGLPGLPRILESLWDELGQPRDVRVVSTMQSAVPLIAAGLGVGLVPDTFSTIAPEAVVTRRVRQQVPPLEAAMLWSATADPTPAMTTFFDIALTPGPAVG